jgi:hypothetical protein
MTLLLLVDSLVSTVVVLIDRVNAPNPRTMRRLPPTLPSSVNAAMPGLVAVPPGNVPINIAFRKLEKMDDA